MTGPGEGKIEVPCTGAVLRTRGKVKALRPVVYIHIRGYSRARVTHIDVEEDGLEDEVRVRPGETVPAILDVSSRFVVRIPSLSVELILYVPQLLRLLRGYRGGCVVGGKVGGIFIGVKREVIQVLEKFGTEQGYPPRRVVET